MYDLTQWTQSVENPCTEWRCRVSSSYVKTTLALGSISVLVDIRQVKTPDGENIDVPDNCLGELLPPIYVFANFDR